MKRLLAFLCALEERNISYRLEHNRDDFIMVLVAVPGERWEIEFPASGDVEIEIFKSSGGVMTDESLLEQLLTGNAVIWNYV